METVSKLFQAKRTFTLSSLSSFTLILFSCNNDTTIFLNYALAIQIEIFDSHEKQICVFSHELIFSR